jgi:predicted SprT family Zn-dependent metalloprotease
MPVLNPTKRAYDDLAAAYDFFNTRLFQETLPRCLITMQRKNKAYGYFAGGRFSSVDGKEITDEIALNPSHFKARTTEQSLSTLVHEMVHLWQHHHGQPSRSSYHNKEWAAQMKAVGLVPSDTGAPGGNETGQRVSHYIAPGGAFAYACAALVADGFAVPYVELWGEAEKTTRKTKAASKTKYTCPECDLNAWAKPDVHLRCGDCETAMEAQDGQVEELQARFNDPASASVALLSANPASTASRDSGASVHEEISPILSPL